MKEISNIRELVIGHLFKIDLQIYLFFIFFNFILIYVNRVILWENIRKIFSIN